MRLSRVILLGLLTFLAVRAWLLVTKAGKPVSQAVVEALLVPVQFLMTVFGLAFQPDKWNEAGQTLQKNFNKTLTGTFHPAKLQQGALDTYSELAGLVTKTKEQPGAEVAQQV